VTEQAAKLYLDKMSYHAPQVVDMFGIDSPWRNSSVIALIDLKYHQKICGGADACAGNGTVVLPYFSNDFFSDFDSLNTAAQVGEMFHFNESTLVHELSHAMRGGIADPWWGLEEGLAVYTANYYQEPLQEPSGVAHKIFDREIQINGTFFIPARATDGELNLQCNYSNRDTLNCYIYSDSNNISVSIFPNDWSTVEDLLLYHGITTGEDGTTASGSLKVYRRAVEHVSETDETEYKYLDVRQHGISCGELSYRVFSEVLTEDGYVTATAPDDGFNVEAGSSGIPYVKLESFEHDNNSLFDRGAYYNTGYCFWGTLRDRYGKEAVNTMVQSMVEFSKSHQNECPTKSNFPFFDTFRQVTGMNEADAKTYFDRFSVPTEDKWYPLGGVVWNEK